MEEAERYVRTWVAAPRDKEIEDTVSGMGHSSQSGITVILRSF